MLLLLLPNLHETFCHTHLLMILSHLEGKSNYTSQCIILYFIFSFGVCVYVFLSFGFVRCSENLNVWFRTNHFPILVSRSYSVDEYSVSTSGFASVDTFHWFSLQEDALYMFFVEHKRNSIKSIQLMMSGKITKAVDFINGVKRLAF